MPSTSHGLSIRVYGHSSADPESVAKLFGGEYLTEADGLEDVAIFAINPNSGIDQKTISNWNALDDFQTPRVIVVTHLDTGEADFDDAVLLVNRLFDKVVTPYLVLHDDHGAPCALISLDTEEITDFSQFPETTYPSDSEHRTLVSEFVEEYKSHVAAMGDGAFAAGLLFPAIPLVMDKRMGISILENYLKQITL
jgi:hypothetical protein